MAHRFLTFRRRLLTCLTVLSLLLFVVTVAVWIRSHFAFDVIVYYTAAESGNLTQRSVSTVNYSGRLMFGTSRGWTDVENPPGWEHYGGDHPQDVPWPLLPLKGRDPSHGWGFVYFADDEHGPYASFTSRNIILPHYFLAVLFAIVPLIRLRVILRDRRLRRVGYCRKCGYDLRASPERCPECGHSVQHADSLQHGGTETRS